MHHVIVLPAAVKTRATSLYPGLDVMSPSQLQRVGYRSSRRAVAATATNPRDPNLYPDLDVTTPSELEHGPMRSNRWDEMDIRVEDDEHTHSIPSREIR